MPYSSRNPWRIPLKGVVCSNADSRQLQLLHPGCLLPAGCAVPCPHLEGVAVFELVIQDGAQPQVAGCIQGLTTHAGPLQHKGDKQAPLLLLLELVCGCSADLFFSCTTPCDTSHFLTRNTLCCGSTTHVMYQTVLTNTQCSCRPTPLLHINAAVARPVCATMIRGGCCWSAPTCCHPPGL